MVRKETTRAAAADVAVPPRTKDLILHAARAQFAKAGYDGATVRAIAGSAGVDPALVLHYFGSKEALFGATLAMADGIPQRMLATLDGRPEEFGRRLASAYLDLWEDPETGPMLASLVRSVLANATAADAVRRLLEGTLLAAGTSKWTAERINLAAAQMYGVAVARYIVRTEPLASMPSEEVVGLVAPHLQALLDE